MDRSAEVRCGEDDAITCEGKVIGAGKRVRTIRHHVESRLGDEVGVAYA